MVIKKKDIILKNYFLNFYIYYHKQEKSLMVCFEHFQKKNFKIFFENGF